MDVLGRMEQTGMIKNNPTFVEEVTKMEKVVGPIEMKITNCSALSFRKEPDKFGKLEFTGNEKLRNCIMVDEIVTLKRKVNEEWSEIITKEGKNGFVMSKYITEV